MVWLPTCHCLLPSNNPFVWLFVHLNVGMYFWWCSCFFPSLSLSLSLSRIIFEYKSRSTYYPWQYLTLPWRWSQGTFLCSTDQEPAPCQCAAAAGQLGCPSELCSASDLTLPFGGFHKFHKWGIPKMDQNGWFINGKSQSKIDDLGVPQCQETSILQASFLAVKR